MELPESENLFFRQRKWRRENYKIFVKYQWLLKLLPKINGVVFQMCPEYVIGAGLWH